MKRVGLLVLGSFINSLGTGLSTFGLAVVILRAYGTASSVAAVQMSAFAPIVLLAPLAGVLADRYDRRLMMMIGDAGSILGLGVILAALSSPRPSLGWICAGAVISSCLAALTEPALRASVTDLVSEEDYVRSSGLLQLASAAKYLLAPAAAGFLMPLVGPWSPAAGCRHLPGHRGVHRDGAPRPGDRDAATHRAPPGRDRSIMAGWLTVSSHPALRSLVVLMTMATLAIGVVQVLLKPILLPTVSTAEMGVVETVAATGMLMGAALVTAWKSAQPTTLLAAGLAGTGAAMSLLPVGPGAGGWPSAVSSSSPACPCPRPGRRSLCAPGSTTLSRRAPGAPSVWSPRRATWWPTCAPGRWSTTCFSPWWSRDSHCPPAWEPSSAPVLDAVPLCSWGSWARPWPWWPSPFVSSDVGSPRPVALTGNERAAPR